MAPPKQRAIHFTSWLTSSPPSSLTISLKSLHKGGYADNSSHEFAGTTPNGTKWTYHERNGSDCEDDDSSYKFTLGDLEIKRTNSRGRDDSSNSYGVSVKGELVYSCSSRQSRDYSYDGNHPMKGDSGEREDFDKAIENAAGIEGVSAKELLEAMPKTVQIPRC